MIWYVAVGSALGGVARYLVGIGLQRLSGGTFPFGTLAVNVVGSLLIGFVLQLALEGVGPTPATRTFLVVGVLGGFTTFSAFSWETVALLETEGWGRAGVYVAASLVLSVAAVAIGIGLARWMTLRQ